MANTIIKFKTSTGTNTPANGSLGRGVPAYSYASDKLFIGNTTGDGYIEVGGGYWINTIMAAYDAANSAGNSSTVNSAFAQANTARDQANAAYTQANTVYGATNLAWTQANTALSTGQGAFNAANIAWATANSKFSANGGTINGDVSISGNLTITGNTAFVNVATYTVQDPLIYLASNNYSSDLVDIGFIGNYSNGACTTIHTGIFRDAGSKEYYVFQGYDKEPENNTIDINGNNFTIAVLNANLRTSNLILNGIVNAYSWIANAYTTANSGVSIGQAAYGAANSGWYQANSALSAVQAAYGAANNGWYQANTALSTGQSAYGAANLAWSQANTAFAQANLVYGQANTALSTGQGAYGSANLAWAQANAAYSQANAAWASANSASNITSGTLAVNYGGTGRNTLTANAVLIGNGTGGITSTSGTEGQVLQVNNLGVPVFDIIDGGTF
jgi:hypothetical protein